ncbi:MAG: helix-turn-helix transcriptional regulator [Clostridia bacterium]|nr:helix-turn-helix transcriptional regulator [Clostridia bacterium]
MSGSLNENIRRFRLEQSLSQVEFARRLNVSKQCVSNWENDNVRPSVEMLTKIADCFQVSTDALLGRDSLNTLNVDGLSPEQIAHIRLLVSDFKNTGKNGFVIQKELQADELLEQ